MRPAADRVALVADLFDLEVFAQPIGEALGVIVALLVDGKVTVAPLYGVDCAAHAQAREPGGADARLGNQAGLHALHQAAVGRSEEHTSELQSLMRISYAVFCLKKKQNTT